MGEHNKKILIVEDEKAIASALELKLKHEGYEVQCVFDGNSALELLKNAKFDLILLDLIMPQMDGFGVLTELKARNDKTSVIVLSNLSQAEDMTRAKELGAKDFFIKSDIPIAEVIKKVHHALGEDVSEKGEEVVTWSREPITK
jgi:two-component system response regulator VicR